MRKEEEWQSECMEEREITVEAGAETIGETERKRIAHRKKHNSKYFLESAKNLLKTNTPQSAVVLAYFAVETKVEQALALKGYKVETHHCTITGLSRVLEEPDLATEMNRAYSKRKDVNYNTKLDERSENPKKFIEERIEPLINSINKKIKEIN